jgi:subtilisin family serine protease
MRRAIALCVGVLILALVVQAKYLNSNVEYAQNRFIVKLWPGVADLAPVFDGVSTQVSDAYLTSLNEKWKVIQVERLFPGELPKESPDLDLAGYWRFWVAEPENTDLEAVLSDYAGAPLVEHVEPVSIHRVSYNPNDTYWSNQWYIRSTAGDHDIDAVEGWDVERGDTLAILGIVDTGVQYSHPDLRAMMWRNWAERNGTPGVDDDGNGLVDDTVGWDWVSGISGCASGEDCSTPDADPKDYAGHGTHCSGIAAAQTNNGTGVAGIAGGGTGYTGARIMALRAGWLASDGYGYVAMDFCASAINYARQKGVCAINCSWGSSNDGGLGAAVTSAINAGIVFCVAAGNDNSSTPDYLGSRGDCIDVAATDASDVKAWFSNYGSWVDVSAPGVNIYSTFSYHYTNTYEYLDGTSMAAPCVTGEVGLLKSLYPAWTRPQITDAIVNNVDNIYDENPSWTGLLGSGRINVNLALLSFGTITVLDPNGGETWVVNTTDTVRWSSQNYAGNVDITINRSYPGGPWENIATNTANDGSELWLVTVPTTTQARIRVIGSSNPAVGDTSDANFTISSGGTITVLVPNGGETWYTGTSQTISWSSSGVSGNVKIELNRTYPSVSWETLYASTSNDGSESWPVSGTATTQARIRISSVNQPSIMDTSNNNFTIANPLITVVDPNGGEIWTQNQTQTFTWTGGGVSGNVKIELNRDYPSGSWETLYASVPYSNYAQDWVVTIPATTTARARISSVSAPSVTDVSDADFTINESGPPEILHDPLDDGEPGSVLVVASVIDDEPGSTIKVFYKALGASSYDSMAMAATGNPNEFSATLGPLGAGFYQYYLRAKDVDNHYTTTDVYDFRLYPSCGTTISYDDGSPDRFNWGGAEDFRWAVKFTPATTFVLCGAEVAISRTRPDSAHTPFRIEVYSESGGWPGTVLFTDTTGSIGNVVGGLPPGQTYWANVVTRDVSGEPLVLNGNFFIAVSNPDTLFYEAFARDTTSTNSGRSFLYDGCLLQWYNENDGCDNCKPGNRMIRALGYYQAPPTIVVYRSGDDAELHWAPTGAPYYRIYSDTTPFGSYATLEGTATDTLFFDTGAVSAGTMRFYRVVSSTLP